MIHTIVFYTKGKLYNPDDSQIQPFMYYENVTIAQLDGHFKVLLPLLISSELSEENLSPWPVCSGGPVASNIRSAKYRILVSAVA